jgi:hypothetical protein
VQHDSKQKAQNNFFLSLLKTHSFYQTSRELNLSKSCIGAAFQELVPVVSTPNLVQRKK